MYANVSCGDAVVFWKYKQPKGKKMRRVDSEVQKKGNHAAV